VSQYTWSTLLLAAGIALVSAAAVAADPLITSIPSPAVRLTPPPRTFSLVATGDVLTESLVTSAAAAHVTGAGERFNFAPLFAPVAAMISSADIAICHMEMPIGAPGDRPGVYGRSPFGGNLILAPYEIAEGLRRTGFDRCSTASNHSNDLGEPGIATTLAALDSAGITHAGTARFPAESTPTILTVSGIRVAHLVYTRYSNTVLPSDPWRVNFAATPAQVAADIKAVRAAGAEVVVVSLHLSKELQAAPDPIDRQFVTDLTALAQVDLVIEHGPHVIQPVERVNGTWVYWSVGNFISGMGTAASGKYSDQRTLDGLAATARFTETSSGTFAVEPWPVLVCNEPFTRTVYAPSIALGEPLPAIVRSGLEACLQRSRLVVTPLH
jgi:poly-gamma-glutamate synthesis protein (capsule biosynthesis protein)